MRWLRLAVCQWRVESGPSLHAAYLKYQRCDELTATSSRETTIYCNLSPRDGEWAHLSGARSHQARHAISLSKE